MLLDQDCRLWCVCDCLYLCLCLWFCLFPNVCYCSFFSRFFVLVVLSTRTVFQFLSW